MSSTAWAPVTAPVSAPASTITKESLLFCSCSASRSRLNLNTANAC